jgi:DNA mismatch repair protein MSH6
MPPAKQKQQQEGMKQKSLMGWFSNPPDAKSSPVAAKPTRPRLSSTVADASSSTAPSSSLPLPQEPETPVQKKKNTAAVSDANFTKSSDGGSSMPDVPPSSDPIDVDILSDEEARRQMRSVRN